MRHLTLFVLFILTACHSNQNITNTEREKIISELNYIGKIDQKYSSIPSEDLIKKYGTEKVWKIYETKRDSVGTDNRKRIKNLYSKYGYLGFREVGKENATKFWLPIQHSDNDVKFQEKMLKVLKKQIENNNANRDEYAMLEDRVAINLNQKQRFGSQVIYSEEGQAIPKNGLTDSVNIERLRSEYNLPSFKEYYNLMTTNHFEMNKPIFLKKGIKEPKLYQ